MTELRTFKVLPNLPEKLAPLYEIAKNLWLTWHPEAVRLFVDMDETLWEETYHNPVKFLGEIRQKRLDELAGNPDYVAAVADVYNRFQEYLGRVRGNAEASGCRIGYFSFEFGLSESLPLYSGGLGVLSGDHIKSASDLGLSFFGVSLLYQLGYSQQYLNPDGWQQDFYRTNDFFNMRVQEVKNADGKDVEVTLDWPAGKLVLKAWKIEVGGARIYLLDANIPKNSEQKKRLTAQLYGGDREMRLQQEIILGIGGMRLLDKLGFELDVLHMNEGHSAFAPFERARLMMEKEKSLKFVEAIEVVRRAGVFTTHTPVPAGNDEFDAGLIHKYFSPYIGRLGIGMDEFLSFGRVDPSNGSEPFNMTVAALKNSRFSNGVSRLHAEVSRDMWKHLWPDIPVEHVPITPVTNGIHIPTWISEEMRGLLDRHLGGEWETAQDSREDWEKLDGIPDGELWQAHQVHKERLVQFTRARLQAQLTKKGASAMLLHRAQEALRPDVLTIGFARRFATYKRGDLIMRNPDRLMALLTHADRPLQLIFAGKAHPQDHAGKEVIKNIIHFINTYNLLGTVVFLEDYDINVARHMVQGVDVWLNTPLRPFEASGTSGMKAAVNGGLHFSVLDGWWDEAYDHGNGWAIGSGEEYSDRDYQSEVEAHAIYSILENDILPLYYDRDSGGLSRQWIQMMKRSIVSIASYFNTDRMVKEYNTKFYREAGNAYRELKGGGFAPVTAYIAWRDKVRKEFPRIKVGRVVVKNGQEFRVGEAIEVSAELNLGQLKPEDVRVDAYYGDIGPEDRVENSSLQRLEQIEEKGEGRFEFTGAIPGSRAGQFALRIRITPYHDLVANPYDLKLVIWD